MVGSRTSHTKAGRRNTFASDCSLSFARHLSILKTAIQAAPRPRKGIISPELGVVSNINLTSACHTGRRAKRRRSDVSRITRKARHRTSQEPGQGLLRNFQKGDAAAKERFASFSAAAGPKLATRCLSWRANMALPVGRSSRSTYNPGRVYSHGRLWRWHDALLAAVQRSDRKTIDVLLRAGADINARSHFWAGGLSLSVLHACAHDMAAFLIERAPPWMRMQPPASAGSKSCRTW
jgi:hypothetical protein